MGTPARVLIRPSRCACTCRTRVLLKMPSLCLREDETSWLPPGSIGTELIPCTASKGASKHLARASKRNVLYLFLTLSHRRALSKVTSDQLLLAGFFFPPLSRGLCRRGRQ